METVAPTPTKRPYVRRTPGLTAPPEGLPEDDTAAVEAEIAGNPLPVPADPDAPKNEQMVMLSMEQLENLVERKVRQRVSENAAAASPRGLSLPDQSEIDPHKIDRDVLTKQGYVCPIKPADQRDMDLVSKRG